MNPVAPFAPNAGRESFFEAEATREAFQRLSDAMGDREPFLLVTGEPGCGKTALVREAIARWGERVRAAWLSFPARTESELVEEIVRRLGVDPPAGASVPRLVACFEQALGEIAAREQLAIIVVDDAHALEPGMLEELRLLVNAAQRAGRPIEVLLVGLPGLAARLEEPGLATLRQRVSVRCGLEPLSPADTRRYLHHRVSAAGGDGPGQFARKSCREIATQSRGLPREINALATEALRLTRAAGQSTVGTDHVRAAATSLWSRTLVSAAELATPAVPAAQAAPSTLPPPGTPIPGASAPAPPAVPATNAPVVKPGGAAPRREAGPATAATPAPEAPKPATLSAPPTPQDPREWVKRFVGDQGPVRIGSRAAAPASWGADDSDARIVPRVASANRHAATAGAESAARSEPPARPELPTRSEPPARPTYASTTPPSPHGNRAPMLVPALVTLVLVVAVGMLVRAGGERSSPHAGAPRVAVQPQRPTVPVPAQVTSTAPVVIPATPNAEGGGESRARATMDATPTDSDVPAKASHLTLDVGRYLTPERAASERERLRARTGLDAWVVRESAAGGESYHVVLGIYRSDARAAAAADLLLAEGKVSQVRVVPLPPRRARR